MGDLPDQEENPRKSSSLGEKMNSVQTVHVWRKDVAQELQHNQLELFTCA